MLRVCLLRRIIEARVLKTMTFPSTRYSHQAQLECRECPWKRRHVVSHFHENTTGQPTFLFFFFFFDFSYSFSFPFFSLFFLSSRNTHLLKIIVSFFFLFSSVVLLRSSLLSSTTIAVCRSWLRSKYKRICPLYSLCVSRSRDPFLPPDDQTCPGFVFKSNGAEFGPTLVPNSNESGQEHTDWSRGSDPSLEGGQRGSSESSVSRIL